MPTLDWREFFQGHRLFKTSPLTDSEIDGLLAPGVGKEMTYAASEAIVSQDDEGESLFFIGEGSVSVSIHMPDEKEIVLGSLVRNDYFGEMTLLGKRRRSATVRAREPTVLLKLNGFTFRTMLAKHPSAVSDMLLELSERLGNLAQTVLDVSHHEVTDKLELFSTKLDAELKAAHAELTASKTVFEQTTTRAHEAIESSERAWSYLTKIGSGVSAVVIGIAAIIGFFGWNKIENVTNEINKTVELANEAINKANTAVIDANISKQASKDILNQIQERHDEISELSTKVVDLKDALISTSATGLFPYILDAYIQQDSNKDAVHSSTVLYKTIMRNGNMNETTRMFKTIQQHILSTKEKAEFTKDSLIPGASPSPSYKITVDHLYYLRNILESVLYMQNEENIKPRDIALSYYLLIMTNLITGDVSEARDNSAQLQHYIQTSQRNLLLESDKSDDSPFRPWRFKMHAKYLEEKGLMSSEYIEESQKLVDRVWRLLSNK